MEKKTFSWKSFLQNVGVILGAIASILLAVVKIVACSGKLKKSAA
jgi:hypothetical protein